MHTETSHNTSLKAGSLLDRAPGAKYSAALRFAELGLRTPMPRIPTLRRWTHEFDGVAFALRAPRSAVVSERGPLRMDEEMASSMKWLIEAAQALSAVAIVLPTPSDLTPGLRSRQLLAEHAQRLRESGQSMIVWEPSGAWDDEELASVAARLDLVVAFDPMLSPRPPGHRVYARLRTLGARQSFATAALEDVLATVMTAETSQAFVAIDSPRSFREAVQLQALADTPKA